MGTCQVGTTVQTTGPLVARRAGHKCRRESAQVPSLHYGADNGLLSGQRPERRHKCPPRQARAKSALRCRLRPAGGAAGWAQVPARVGACQVGTTVRQRPAERAVGWVQVPAHRHACQVVTTVLTTAAERAAAGKKASPELAGLAGLRTAAATATRHAQGKCRCAAARLGPRSTARTTALGRGRARPSPAPARDYGPYYGLLRAWRVAAAGHKQPVTARSAAPRAGPAYPLP